MALVVKNPPANAVDVSDMSLITGSGTLPGGGQDNPLQYILALEIPWTEQPGRLQSLGCKELDLTKAT